MQARPSWHGRRAISALLATALAGGAAGALLLAQPPPTAAAGVPAAGISITPSGYGPVHLGPMAGPAGSDEHGYCVQARVTASTPSDVPQGEVHVDDPELAAALARHRFATDDVTQAALGYAVHQRQERPGTMAGGVVEATKLLIAAATPQPVKDRAAEVLGQGADEAGPWSGSAGSVTGEGRRTGTIEGITLTSVSGRPLVGAPFTVTLSGPAVLDATGTQTFTGTTSAEPISLTWTATGNGTVSYEVVFPEAWRTTLTVLTMSGNRQDQLTYGNRPGHDPREVVVAGAVFQVVRDFRPVATTTVQDVVVQDGDPLVDVVEFAAAPGDEWVEVEGIPVPVVAEVTWYGPYDRPQPQLPSVPAGAPVAGIEQVVAEGPGRVVSPGSVRATGNGFYTAVVSIRVEAAGGFAPYLREDFTAPFFEEAETAVNRFDLEHESQTREFNVAPGGRAFDRITVTGYPDDHGRFEGLGRWAPDLGAATVTVYGPLAAVPDTPQVPDDAPVFWTDTVPAVNGVYDVGYDDANPVVAPTRAVHPGGDYFVFVYAFAGDDRVDAFVSPFDDVREVFHVPGPPEVVVPPSVVTRAQPTAVAGEPIHDVALVTGTTDPGDHLVFRAFGPQDPGADAVCDESTLHWTSEPVPVDGAGLYDSGATPGPREPGAVYWVESLLTAEGHVRHEGRCGIANETTLVTEPLAVRTQATAATASGADGSDAEGGDTGDAGEAGGTGGAGAEGVDVPDAEDVQGTGAEGADGTGAADEDDTGEDLSTSAGAGGAGSEGGATTTAHAPEVVAPNVAAGDGLVAGVDIWDVVVVEGTVPAGAVTVVDLFHAAPGDPLVCVEPVWTSAPIPLTAGGGVREYVTGRFATTEPGTYGFVQRTTSADGTALSTGECGDPTETLLLAAPEVPDEPVAPVPPDQPLAVTGGDVALVVTVAVLLLAAGAAVVGYRVRLRRELEATAGEGAVPDGGGRWPSG